MINKARLANIIICIMGISFFLIIPIAIFFLWNEQFTYEATINDGKFGTFGDFFGGVLGSIWSLGGVILFYIALTEQRKDFKNNSEALGKQIEALDIQTNEFRLQKEEMKLAREIYKEQAKTLLLQRIDNNFFSLIALYKECVKELNGKKDGTYFKDFKKKIKDSINIDHNDIHFSILDEFQNQYFILNDELEHYFKLVYRILKMIDLSEMTDQEKFGYIKIFRSQMSTNEMLAIYYNSHSIFAGESYRLILRYNLLKHLPHLSKIELSRHLEKKDIFETNPEYLTTHNFICALYKMLEIFRNKISQEIQEDDFEETSTSLEIKNKSGNLILSIKSSTENYLSIRLYYTDGKSIDKIFIFSNSEFKEFMCDLLKNIFWLSRYALFEDEKHFVQATEEGNKLVFSVSSDKKLHINMDID